MADRIDARREASPWGALPLALLGGVLAVTAAWWALALWPLPGDAPAWLARARAVCFGSGADGLPDASGWVALIVQPAVMLGIVVAGWGRGLVGGVRRLARSGAGRASLAAAGGAIVLGAGLAAHRIATAAQPPAPLPERVRRLDGTAPSLDGLVDHHGRPLSLDRYAGRPLLVTFAFGHCETVCPIVVEGALRARRRLARTGGPVPDLVVVTLDPWRDTPARLPTLAERWNLDDGATVGSGEVGVVESVLDAWGVPRSRDPRTGDVVHPPLVHVVDHNGNHVAAAGGDPAILVTLVRELEP